MTVNHAHYLQTPPRSFDKLRIDPPLEVEGKNGAAHAPLIRVNCEAGLPGLFEGHE